MRERSKARSIQLSSAQRRARQINAGRWNPHAQRVERSPCQPTGRHLQFPATPDDSQTRQLCRSLQSVVDLRHGMRTTPVASSVRRLLPARGRTDNRVLKGALEQKQAALNMAPRGAVFTCLPVCLSVQMCLPVSLPPLCVRACVCTNTTYGNNCCTAECLGSHVVRDDGFARLRT